jgi:hypothetical protein
LAKIKAPKVHGVRGRPPLSVCSERALKHAGRRSASFFTGMATMAPRPSPSSIFRAQLRTVDICISSHSRLVRFSARDRRADRRGQRDESQERLHDFSSQAPESAARGEAIAKATADGRHVAGGESADQQ